MALLSVSSCWCNVTRECVECGVWLSSVHSAEVVQGVPDDDVPDTVRLSVV